MPPTTPTTPRPTHLVLSRRLDEEIVFAIPPSPAPREIRVAIAAITRRDDASPRIRLGCHADQDVEIFRGELQPTRNTPGPVHGAAPIGAGESAPTEVPPASIDATVQGPAPLYELRGRNAIYLGDRLIGCIAGPDRDALAGLVRLANEAHAARSCPSCGTSAN